MKTRKTPPPITLTPSNRLRMPPRAETIALMPDVVAKLRGMQTPVFVPPQGAHLARIAELEQEAAAAKAQLHAYASQAWLEAEARLQQQARMRHIQRMEQREQSRVTDHTLPDQAPQCVVTADTVKLKLALNPRTAVPMSLPVFSAIKRWFKRKP